jgi:TfoX/Sxy family transcriptional regulator of competence genes
MQFKRPSPALVELFQKLLPATGGAGRTMFGCPCGFLGGNMFMGLFADQLFLRLAEPDRAKLLAEEGAEPFDPMGGRPMREYVVVPPAWLEGDADDELRGWIAKSVRYAKTLPPKASKAAGKKKAAKAKSRPHSGKG